MNIEDLKEIKFENLTDEDKWILSKYENIVKSSIKHMDKYEFNLFGSETYSFIYDDFCSNYIEFAKFNNESNTTKSVLCYVLTGILKLLHPFMPFVTEEIYQMLPVKDNESIMISKYPEYNKEYVFTDSLKSVNTKIEFIKKFRNIKAENSIAKDAKVFLDNAKVMVLKKYSTKAKDNYRLKCVKANLSNFANFYYNKENRDELIALIKVLVPEISKIIEPKWGGTDEPYLSSWMKKYNITLKKNLQ